MKVLVIHATPWNDQVYGNNVLSNWFEGMDVEIVNIYRGAGLPRNQCCTKYFQISDRMIINSLLKRKKAGMAFSTTDMTFRDKDTKNATKYKKFSNEFTQLCRSIAWSLAEIDEEALKKFVKDFSPDVVFTCRKASLATLRLERIVHKYTNAPFVAFTGDDEYSLKQFRFSPFFWIDRLAVRSSLRRNVKFYKRYLTLSEDQADEYKRMFNIQTGVLRKAGTYNLYNAQKEYSQPIKVLYAGKLYCNRWKTLQTLAQEIYNINTKYGKDIFQLDIYAVGEVKRRFLEWCNEVGCVRIHKPVSAKQLSDVFRSSHIVLHVESMDIRNRLDTRYSFSTKIVDCLSSGCAVMAVCWDQQTGYKYLKVHDLALCIQENEIGDTLKRLMDDKSIILQYANKANEGLSKFHNKQVIQQALLYTFSSPE